MTTLHVDHHKLQVMGNERALSSVDRSLAESSLAARVAGGVGRRDRRICVMREIVE